MDKLIPFLSIYTCRSNSRNLSLSAMSWSAYLNFSTHPKMLGRIITPSGMHGSAIVTSYYLHDDLCIGCFPILLSVMMDGLSS
jgi:hypothetical protein